MQLNLVEGLNRVYIIPQVETELKKLFGKSQKDLNNYKEYLISQLQIVERVDKHLDEFPFEHLKETHADLYRIRSKSKRKNVRVIYYYQIDEKIVLLCAFEERSKADYDRAIALALKRIKEIERVD